MAAASPVTTYTSLYERNRQHYETIINQIQQRDDIEQWKKQCITYGINYLFKIVQLKSPLPDVITETLQTLETVSRTASLDMIKTHIVHIADVWHRYSDSLEFSDPPVINFNMDTLLRLSNMCLDSNVATMSAFETATRLYDQLFPTNKPKPPIADAVQVIPVGKTSVFNTVASVRWMIGSVVSEWWKPTLPGMKPNTSAPINFDMGIDFESLPSPSSEEIQKSTLDQDKEHIISLMKTCVDSEMKGNTEAERLTKRTCLEKNIRTAYDKHEQIKPFRTLSELRVQLQEIMYTVSVEERGRQKNNMEQMW